MKNYFKQQSDEMKHQIDQAESAMDAAALLDALINLLTEKGVIGVNEYQEHVKKVKELPVYKEAYEKIANQRRVCDEINEMIYEDLKIVMEAYT